MTFPYRIGVDENGLGARLGPMIVTAVLARVDERGSRTLGRKLPKRIRADLDDSKRLVSHGDVRLAEAWARSLSPGTPRSPQALLDTLLLESKRTLSEPCPSHVKSQCWNARGEDFQADSELCQRIEKQREALAERGVTLVSAVSSVWCTKRLNEARERGVNRFVADLHAMEALVLSLRERARDNVVATCGKVGGIGSYGKFFGPLNGVLHSVVEEGHKQSRYYFPSVGELHFVRDADASNPLVMLASLVGKYVRELLMARIVRFYPEHGEGDASPSGYHDPVSDAFVERTLLARHNRRVPDTCFERARAAEQLVKPRVRAERA